MGPSSVGCGAGVPVRCTGVLVRDITAPGVPECATCGCRCCAWGEGTLRWPTGSAFTLSICPPCLLCLLLSLPPLLPPPLSVRCAMFRFSGRCGDGLLAPSSWENCLSGRLRLALPGAIAGKRESGRLLRRPSESLCPCDWCCHVSRGRVFLALSECELVGGPVELISSWMPPK